MKFLKRTRKPKEEVNLDRYRHKKIWRWVWGILAGLVLFVALWYGYGVFRAYRAATVANTSSDSSSALKDAMSRANAGPINVLLIGIEGPNYPGGLLSDTMMVASVDTKARTVSLLSFPRDLYVTVPGYGKEKINAAHSLAEQAAAKKNEKGKGPELLRTVIKDTFNVPIHYFVRLDFDGFRKVIDALGGVDVTVQTAIHDPFYPNGTGGYATFSIKAGPQHLNGETALKYARSRQTTSDFDRARRQQQIVSAIKDKLLSPQVLANPKKMTDLITIIGSHVLTDFSLAEINDVVSIAKEMPDPKIRTQVLDTSAELGLLRSSTSSGGAYIIIPTAGEQNFRQVETFIQGYFASPRIQAEAPTIQLINGGAKESGVTTLAKQLKWAGFTVTVADTPVPDTKSSLTVVATDTPDSVSFITKAYGIGSTRGSTPPEYDMSFVVGTDWAVIEQNAAKATIQATTSPLANQ